MPIPSDRPVRWGILATGGIADSFCRDLALVDDARIAAVGSRRAESARVFAERHGVARAHGSYPALLADPDVDVVYVATPHPFHEEHTLATLDAGKPVLCEKPLGMRAAEAERMVATARAHGLFLMEAMWMLCTPNVRRLHALVGEGRVGEVRNVRADLGFVLPTDPEARWQDPQLGASTLLDVGVYPLSLVVSLLGEPSALGGSAVLSPRGIDDAASLTLTYASGALATVTCAQNARTDSAGSVAGERGRIEVAAPVMVPPLLRVHGEDPDAEPTIVAEPLLGKGMAHEAVEVHRCLRAGLIESPLVSHAHTVLVARLLDRARDVCGVRLPGD